MAVFFLLLATKLKPQFFSLDFLPNYIVRIWRYWLAVHGDVFINCVELGQVNLSAT